MFNLATIYTFCTWFISISTLKTMIYWFYLKPFTKFIVYYISKFKSVNNLSFTMVLSLCKILYIIYLS